MVGLWVALCCASGCVAEDQRNRGVVVLDPVALQSGALVVQEPGLQASSRLPILVDPTRQVIVRGRQASVRFAVGSGQVVAVRGADLRFRAYRLGSDVASDRLGLVGDDVAIDELAAQVSGRVERGRAGSAVVYVADAYAHAGNVALDGIEETQLIAVGEATALADDSGESDRTPASVREAFTHAALAGLAGSGGSAAFRDLEALDLVGIYKGPDGCLTLNAAGAYRACGGAFGSGRSAQGEFAALRDGVLLRSASGRAITLTRNENGDLVTPDGLSTYMLQKPEARP